MEGVAERDRRAMEGHVAVAWWIENMSRTGDRLRGLGHYLEQLRPRKAQSADDILAVFREHQARGAAIRIRHIGPDGKELN